MPRRPTTYYPDFEKANPFRRPDWAWARANTLVENSRYITRRRDGETVVLAGQFVRAKKRSFRGWRSRKFLRDNKSLVEAIKFAENNGPEVLEAKCRILAKQSLKVIANILRLSHEMLAFYTSLFFDILDRISASTYVMTQVIGLDPRGGASPERFAMSAAYKHGPQVVEHWMDWMDHRGECHNLLWDVGRRRERIELAFDSWNLSLHNQERTKTCVTRMQMLDDLTINSFRGRRSPEILAKQNRTRLEHVDWGAVNLPSRISPEAIGIANSDCGVVGQASYVL